jgi:hypothetical protein
LIIKFGARPRLAHEAIFKARHPIASPDFHLDMIDLMHAPDEKGVIEGFRSSAKSTRAEEAVALMALYKRFHNCVIVGSSQPRAKERLSAIKHELTANEAILYLFGKQEGEKWGEEKIVLANGVCIQAIGMGTSLRGIKHYDWRPDFGLLDDLEDEETVKDPSQRAKTMDWLYAAFLPALAKEPPARVRMLGNRLDTEALVVQVVRRGGWTHIRIPIMEQHDDGVERYDLPPGKWRSTWQGLYSLEKIAKERAEYERMGMLHTWNCEYMCEADDPEARMFSADQQKITPSVRTWQSVFAAYDPARTVNTTSAMTGKAVFSWVGNRLVVWSGDARLWLPSEILDDIFQVNDEFKPIEIGIESAGLEEFIMQPLRDRALARRLLVPIRRLVPPKGKQSFIRGLQPLFKSGQVEFADVSDEARRQLLSFPTGRMDFPNALAYALEMRPGLPVYDEFGRDHIIEGLFRTSDKWYCAVNATNQFTAAVLLQLVGGQVRIFADWIMEGPPGEVLRDIIGQASVEAGASIKIVLSPVLSGQRDTVGLRVAARTNQFAFVSGGDSIRGRESVRSLLTRRRRSEPLLVVDSGARWMLNALAGGYARGVDKRGQVSDEPCAGPYRVLMEGLESFLAQYRDGAVADDEVNVRYAQTDDGRMYKTILPTGVEINRELKMPDYG